MDAEGLPYRPRQDVVHLVDHGPRTSPAAVDAREKSRVIVIDNNLLTAEAIVFALTQMAFSARFVVPVTAGHLRDLVKWQPGLALLDIDSLDTATCLDCLSILRGAGVPVAVMGGQGDAYLLGECVQAGASSVVDKRSPLNELVGTIARMLAGEVVLGEDEKRHLTEPYHREARARRARLAPFDVLTHREKCVLDEIMQGNSAEVIAGRASVSISTVRSQIKAILQKLGVNSQLAAAALARQAGWTFDPAGDSAPKTTSPIMSVSMPVSA